MAQKPGSAPQSQPQAQPQGQQGQAQQQQAQAHQQKLTAAGCPPQQAASLAVHAATAGVNPDHVAELAQLGPSFNWGLLQSLITQFGPAVIGQLIQLFGIGGAAAGAQAQQPRP